MLFAVCVLCFCAGIHSGHVAVSVQAASRKPSGTILKRVSFKKKYTIYTGKTKIVKVRYRTGTKQKRIVWKSSNPAAVQVKASKSGKTCRIKAVSPGKVKITCWPKGREGKKLTCTITVKTRRPKIKSLTVPEKKVYVYVGDKVQNRLTVRPAGAKKSKVKYTSSNPSVAKVDSKGVVTGLKAGTTKITVKSTDGSNKKVKYKVVVRMISFEKTTATLKMGETFSNTLKGMVTRSGASGIKWSSSNPDVAKVSASGVVTAVRKGTALITAKINNKTGASATYMVNVAYPMKRTSAKFIAHRGLSAEVPENTLRAFELAGQAGFWGAETDVRKTADGHFILMHDATFQRMCGVNKKPEELTLEEIRNLKIISGNNYSLYKNDMLATTVPTLEEYLQCCLKYNMVPVIEIKMSYDREEGGVDDTPAGTGQTTGSQTETGQAAGSQMGSGQEDSSQPESGQSSGGEGVGNTSGDNQVSPGNLVEGQILQDMEIADMQDLYRITRQIMGTRDYMFIDFDYITLMKMNEVLGLENRSNITLQYISRTYDSEVRQVCETNGFEYDLYYKGVTQAAIDGIRKNGSRVNLWTVDDQDKAEDYIINGIDYITTNRRFW